MSEPTDPDRPLSVAAAAATDTSRDGSLVVYTAITRGYDVLKEPPADAARDAELVAFLDEPAPSSVWKWRALHAGLDDPCRNAKVHKVLSHVQFPDAACSLWIDGSVSLRPDVSLRGLVERYLAEHDLVVFPHRLRTCVYQEAAVCLQRQLDDPAVILEQVARYTREGYPANAGLVECPVVLRRHTPAVRAFNEAWWNEIANGSKRDQLSFQYVARAVGLRYGLFPGTIRDNPFFVREKHAAAAVPVEPESAAAPAAPPALPERRARTFLAARRRVLFGPVRARPSWNWVGFDTARELSRHYDVEIFRSWRAVPDCDAIVAVKSKPRDDVAAELRDRGVKLVYCPIDVYRDPEQIERDRELLRSCAMVVTHCERLTPLLRPLCGEVHFVEHHARHALTEMAGYKVDGYLLWIGVCQYLPYLAHWLEHHPIAGELRILTNLDDPANLDAARANAERIGMRFDLAADASHFAGHRLFRWSERRQEAMMRECKAALDVKMTTVFGQRHKPPTKAQQFVASGVPVAINADSYSAEYFRVHHGFELASPLEPERWLSRDYWEATRACGEALRATTSLAAVGARYRELLESLWQPRRPTPPDPLPAAAWSHVDDPG